MRIDTMMLARARRALRGAVASLFDPNVTLIDFGQGRIAGETVEDKLSIRFHVRAKLSPTALESAVAAGRTHGRLPERIGGFATDVIPATFRPHDLGWNAWERPVSASRAARANPMRGGISISDERHDAYGTLGGLVVDRQSGAEMILSNWHVLAGDWGGGDSPERGLALDMQEVLDRLGVDIVT